MVIFLHKFYPNKPILPHQINGNNPGRIRSTKHLQTTLLNCTIFSRHENKLLWIEFTYRYKSANLLIPLNSQEINDSSSPCSPSTLRNFKNFEPITFAIIGKKQNVLMSRSDKNMLNIIIIFSPHTNNTSPTTVLLPVGITWYALDISRMGNNDHHLFIGD